MSDFEDDKPQEPIKKKPKIQEVIKVKPTIESKPTLDTNDIRNFINIEEQRLQMKKMKQLCLEELKQTSQEAMPDRIHSHISDDFLQWENKDFVFQLKKRGVENQEQFMIKITEFFQDFNEKCRYYPFKHFTDFRKEKDYQIITQCPIGFQTIEKEEENNNPIEIPLTEIKRVEKKQTVRIKIEQK